MEATEKKKKKSEPKAWLIENGVWTRFDPPKPANYNPDHLSPAGIWMRDHPNFIKILDERALIR